MSTTHIPSAPIPWLRDTYSRSHVADEPLNPELLIARIWRPHLPTVHVVMFLPRVCEPAPGAIELLHDAYAEMLGNESPRPRSGRGRPRRNRYIAAEQAVLQDIERRASYTGRLHEPEPSPRRGWSARAQLRVATGANADAAVTDEGADGARCKTLTRWRDDGRRVLAELGAFPWALQPEGKLGRTWWRDPRFVRALLDAAELHVSQTVSPTRQF